MNTSIAIKRRPAAGRGFLVALSFVLGLAMMPLAGIAKDKAAKPAAPVAVSFAKATGDNGPYVMTVKNTGSDEIKIKISIVGSVQAHNQAKTRDLPAKELAGGAETTVDGLAAMDKVKIHAKGFAPLEVVVPGGSK